MQNGVKIGLFGIIGEEAGTVAPYVKPAAFTNRYNAALDMVRYLKNEAEVDLVICLSHSGVSKDKKGNWVGEDVDLVKQINGIDLIISGHTHTQLFEPITVNQTTIVQSGSEGAFVGRIDGSLNNGQFVIKKASLIPITDDIKGDAEIQQDIEGYQKLIEQTVFKNLNLEPGKALVETDFDLRFNEETYRIESNLGPLVADALHWHINQTIDNDLTLAVAGLIRDEIRVGATGHQLVNDLFRIVPLGSGVYDQSPGYSMAQVYLTAKEIKNVLEAMLLAPKISTGNYAYWSGVRYKYNPRRILLDQVYEVSLGDPENGYETIDLSNKNKQLYSLATNNYVLEFFGLVKQVTMGLLKVVPKDKFGSPVSDLNELLVDADSQQSGLQEMKEWEGFIAYLNQFSDTDGDSIPNVPDYYKNPTRAGQRTPSLNPAKLWGGGNGIMAGVSAVAIAILAATGMLIIL